MLIMQFQMYKVQLNKFQINTVTQQRHTTHHFTHKSTTSDTIQCHALSFWLLKYDHGLSMEEVLMKLD